MLFGLVTVFALIVAGCGGSGLGEVTGKVTLDGQPLAGAIVTFYPQEGRPSIGMTDSEGNYELGFTASEKGAVVGKHTVRITTGAGEDREDESGEDEDQEEGADFADPTIPAKYNSKSELTREVTSGSNEFDFDLQSQ
jgi:hypothetical protein